jgi:hypothetical protein
LPRHLVSRKVDDIFCTVRLVGLGAGQNFSFFRTGTNDMIAEEYCTYHHRDFAVRKQTATLYMFTNKYAYCSQAFGDIQVLENGLPIRILIQYLDVRCTNKQKAPKPPFNTCPTTVDISNVEEYSYLRSFCAWTLLLFPVSGYLSFVDRFLHLHRLCRSRRSSSLPWFASADFRRNFGAPLRTSSLPWFASADFGRNFGAPLRTSSLPWFASEDFRRNFGAPLRTSTSTTGHGGCFGLLLAFR